VKRPQDGEGALGAVFAALALQEITPMHGAFRANQAAETNNNAGRATHLWLSVPSELETRAKLHSAKIVGSGGYSSKRSVSGPEIREAKALVIEGVEHFGAYLEYLTFADLELLGKRSVQVCDAIAS
jgi:hypothetical protein